MRRRCGDGITRTDLAEGEPGFEVCDDGNEDNDDECTTGCARCGDGLLSGDEACDDGNTLDDDACTNRCEVARRGDGIVWAGKRL